MMSPDHDVERKEQVSKSRPSDEEMARRYCMHSYPVETFLEFWTSTIFLKYLNTGTYMHIIFLNISK